jgi:hypothetical protein
MSLPINQSATIKPVSQPTSKPGPPNPSRKSKTLATSMPVTSTQTTRTPIAVVR